MNAEKIHGENVYVNLDEVIETVYQCRRDEANDELVKRWFEPLESLQKIEVSEDCISRSDILGEFFISNAWNRDTRNFNLPVVAVRDIENAPRVVPSREEGKWIVRENGNNECSVCGREKQDGWINFCGFCGAKMKAAEDE